MQVLLIADDHRLFVDGLRLIVDYATDYSIAGVVHNGNEVLPFLHQHRVDILLLDIDLPIKSGKEVAEEVLRLFPSVKILIVSMLNDYHTVKTMLDMGVAGYFLKTAGKDELLRALSDVLKGEPYISPELAAVLINGQRVTAQNPLTQDPLQVLSVREKAVFYALGKGKALRLLLKKCM